MHLSVGREGRFQPDIMHRATPGASLAGESMDHDDSLEEDEDDDDHDDDAETHHWHHGVSARKILGNARPNFRGCGNPKCSNCGTQPRNASAVQPQTPWQCPYCTFRNTLSFQRCQICDKDRPPPRSATDPGSSVAKAIDLVSDDASEQIRSPSTIRSGPVGAQAPRSCAACSADLRTLDATCRVCGIPAPPRSVEPLTGGAASTITDGAMIVVDLSDDVVDVIESSLQRPPSVDAATTNTAPTSTATFDIGTCSSSSSLAASHASSTAAVTPASLSSSLTSPRTNGVVSSLTASVQSAAANESEAKQSPPAGVSSDATMADDPFDVQLMDLQESVVAASSDVAGAPSVLSGSSLTASTPSFTMGGSFGNTASHRSFKRHAFMAQVPGPAPASRAASAAQPARSALSDDDGDLGDTLSQGPRQATLDTVVPTLCPAHGRACEHRFALGQLLRLRCGIADCARVFHFVPEGHAHASANSLVYDKFSKHRQRCKVRILSNMLECLSYHLCGGLLCNTALCGLRLLILRPSFPFSSCQSRYPADVCCS